MCYGLLTARFHDLLIVAPQARVTLARAIYSPAEILILDDVFAALDVHTQVNYFMKYI